MSTQTAQPKSIVQRIAEKKAIKALSSNPVTKPLAKEIKAAKKDLEKEVKKVKSRNTMER